MLPFVPRKVAKALRSRENGTSTLSPAPKVSGLTTSSLQQDNALATGASRFEAPECTVVQQSTNSEDSTRKGKRKEEGTFGTLLEEDCAALLCLSMCEHALWLDGDLRWRVESGDEGFIPMLYLSSRSPYLRSHVTEATLVKAIRAQASDIFDVRMAMSSPSRAEWFGGGSSFEQQLGSFEIRLKTWKDALIKATGISHSDWDSRTIYVECVPPQYRSVAGIHRFLTSICPSRASHSTLTLIQSIVLPKHHLDKSEDVPKCKDFALVTFSHASDASSLLERWPWERGHVLSEDDPPVIREATKYGLRAISKARWDELNSNYLQWRQQLLEQISASEKERSPPLTISEATRIATAPIDEDQNMSAAPGMSTNVPPRQDPSAPYPSGCLVHVRHIHPETNKTTLRKLFAKAFSQENLQTSDGIDYVDFNKGMDTCYLRLSTTKHTKQLVAHFIASPKVQAKGLDDAGCPPFIGSKSITTEIVEGTREELYWLKVPEKLRRQAVQKAASDYPSQPQSTVTNGREGESNRDPEQTKASRRKRKR